MRKRKSVIALTVVLVIAGLLGAWRTGLFAPYNYVTARRDIHKGTIRLISYGLPVLRPVKEQEAELAIQARYGFQRENTGCVVTAGLICGIASYNGAMERYLAQRNGRDWQQRYNAELAAKLRTIRR